MKMNTKMFEIETPEKKSLVGIEVEELHLEAEMLKGKHLQLEEWVAILCEFYQNDLKEAVQYRRKNMYRLEDKKTKYGGENWVLEYVKWMGKWNNLPVVFTKKIVHISNKGKVKRIKTFLPDLVEFLLELQIVKIDEGEVKPHKIVHAILDKGYEDEDGNPILETAPFTWEEPPEVAEEFVPKIAEVPIQTPHDLEIAGFKYPNTKKGDM